MSEIACSKKGCQKYPKLGDSLQVQDGGAQACLRGLGRMGEWSRTRWPLWQLLLLGCASVCHTDDCGLQPIAGAHSGSQASYFWNVAEGQVRPPRKSWALRRSVRKEMASGSRFALPAPRSAALPETALELPEAEGFPVP